MNCYLASASTFTTMEASFRLNCTLLQKESVPIIIFLGILDDWNWVRKLHHWKSSFLSYWFLSLLAKNSSSSRWWLRGQKHWRCWWLLLLLRWLSCKKYRLLKDFRLHWLVSLQTSKQSSCLFELRRQLSLVCIVLLDWPPNIFVKHWTFKSRWWFYTALFMIQRISSKTNPRKVLIRAYNRFLNASWCCRNELLHFDGARIIEIDTHCLLRISRSHL